MGSKLRAYMERNRAFACRWGAGGENLAKGNNEESYAGQLSFPVSLLVTAAKLMHSEVDDIFSYICIVFSVLAFNISQPKKHF